MFFPLKDHNPTRRQPVVTWALMAVNFAIFFYEILQGSGLGDFIACWGATPYELTHFTDLVGRFQAAPQVNHTPGPAFLPMTAISSMFLHGGWLHLLFNMHFLWIFGNNVEDLLGPARFFGFYLVTGLVGLATHVFSDPDSVIPTVGASGAISGVMGAYLVAFPRARVTSLLVLGFFIQFLEVRAVLLIGFWIAIQIALGLVGLGVSAGGGTAYWAHIGGFVAGWIGIRWVARTQLAQRTWVNAWPQAKRSTFRP